jgi:hypothetical protein
MVAPPPRLVGELGVTIVAAGAVFVPLEAADPTVVMGGDKPGHGSELSANAHETVMSNTSSGSARPGMSFLNGGEAGPPTTQPPTTATPAPAGSRHVVHCGAFCTAGETGVTTRGTPMVCGPASEGRDRWHGPDEDPIHATSS